MWMLAKYRQIEKSLTNFFINFGLNFRAIHYLFTMPKPFAVFGNKIEPPFFVFEFDHIYKNTTNKQGCQEKNNGD